MIALLNETVLWWHWIVFGMLLLIAEMTTGTFIMLGLGIAAIIVGIVDTLFATSFSLELSIWMVLSTLVLMIWFKWFKEAPISHSGQSNYRLDTLGTVTAEIAPHQRGKVMFDTPVLGNSSWHATAKMPIPQQTRVKIIQINGQLIEVAPHLAQE